MSSPKIEQSVHEVQPRGRVAQAMDRQTGKQIAQALSVFEKTVSNHLYRVYRRLEVGDRTQAVLMARGRGWI